MNSGTESWTGIGVVAGFSAVVLIAERSHMMHDGSRSTTRVIPIIQGVGVGSKTCNHLCVAGEQTLRDLVREWQSGPMYRRSLHYDQANLTWTAASRSSPDPKWRLVTRLFCRERAY